MVFSLKQLFSRTAQTPTTVDSCASCSGNKGCCSIPTIEKIQTLTGGVFVVGATPDQQNKFNRNFDWNNGNCEMVASLAIQFSMQVYPVVGEPWDVPDKGWKSILFGHPNNAGDDGHGIIVKVKKDGAMEIQAPDTARVIVASSKHAIGLLYSGSSAEAFDLAGNGSKINTAAAADHTARIMHARLHALRQAHNCNQQS